MQLQGHAGPGYFHATTGRFTPCAEQKNLTTIAAADIVASLLNGDASLAISHLYFRYQNSNADLPAPPAITRSTGRADYAAITGAGPAYEDYLRVPLVAQGKQFAFPAGTTDYAANAAYFVANSATSTLVGESPAHNYFAASGPQGPSRIFQYALVAAPVPSDPNQDRVFAVLNLATPHVYLNNSSTFPGAFWTLRLS